MSNLFSTPIANAFNAVEGPGLADAPWTRPGTSQTYADGALQQFQPFVNSYGGVAGEPALLNYTNAVLAQNPTATVGDVYAGYYSGTGTPGSPNYNSFANLSAGTITNTPASPSQQMAAAANFTRNSGVDPNTPASSLIGGGTAPAAPTGSYQQGADTDPNVDNYNNNESAGLAGVPAAPSQPGDIDANAFDGGSGLSEQSEAFGSEGGAGFSSMGIDTPSTASNPNTQPMPGMGSAGQAIGIDTGGYGGTTVAAQGGATSIPGVSTTGTGNFGSTSSAPADNATSDTPSTTVAPVTGGITTGNIPGVNTPTSAGTSTAAAPQGSGQNTQGGTPIQNNIADATAIGQTGLNALSKSATGVGQAVTGAEGNLAAAGTSWLGSIFTGATSLFVRFGLLAAGLIVLLGAFLFFFIDSREGGGGDA
jgi:hypothetical protein